MSSRDYDAPLCDTAEELNRDECFNDLAYRNMTFDRDDRPEHLLSKRRGRMRRTSSLRWSSMELCSPGTSARERRSMLAVSLML